MPGQTEERASRGREMQEAWPSARKSSVAILGGVSYFARCQGFLHKGHTVNDAAEFATRFSCP